MSARELITEHLDLWTGAVTKKSSSGRGSNGKVELTGVTKLRELIFGMAVQGKLTTREARDEPASNILQRNSVRQSQLYTQGKIKKPKELASVSVKEQYFHLPENWEWTRLGSLFDSIMSGGTPSKQNPRFWDGEIPWASVKDLGKTKHLDKTQDYITEEGLKAGSKLADTGDVLICTRMGLGKVAICSKPIAINQDLKAVKISPEVSLDYFFLAYTTLDITGTGTTVAGITQDKLLNYVIGLPPIEEQHRIVQKVDELMALCDRLEQQTSDQLEAHETLVDTLLGTLTQSENVAELADKWARLAAHFDTLFTTEQSIDKLKKTILQLAVMGRLMEQDSEDEPTAQLLERVSNEKQRLIKSKILKRTKSLAPLDTSALQSIPESWSWVNLGDIISVMDAGWSPACPPRPADPEKWGVLKTTAVQVMKYQEFENKQLPDNKAPKEQYEVRSGDILITRAGPKNRVGITCVVKETRDKLMISDKIIRFHLIETGLSEEYICLCLNAGETYNYLEQAKSGMAESQMNISQDKLKAAPVPLCPANEQHRIVQKVDELTALCDQLKERLNQAGETRCQLAEAVVEGALSE
ncbi:MAG: restriction endonuclease subunit S [Marinobacter sp.]